MKRYMSIITAATVLAVIVLGGFYLNTAHCANKGNKYICITFDDLPVVRIHDRIERLNITDAILTTLEEFKVTAAGFVIGDNIEGDIDIIKSWLDAGHDIGNHTFSHPDLNEVPPALFIQDIDKGYKAIEGLLKEAGKKKKYFRYPNLHYGSTPDARETVDAYLEKEGYTVAHVSIDTDDFVYNLQFEKITTAGDSLDLITLGNEYLDHLTERLEAAEKLAEEVVGLPINHILLLHANQLNGFFLTDILTDLQTRGYTFISLPMALKDPVYAMPDTYCGPKGLSILERLAKTDPDLLPARE